jgi:hypothetical protein
MTEIETRLRSELKTLAEQVRPESIRPLREPVRRRKSLTLRWLAPVTAVVAVLAIITGVSLIGHTVKQRPTPPATAMPPYYVTLNDGASHLVLTVRSSATGQVLASTSLPHSPENTQWISGAADDRTFVLSDGIGRYLLLKLSAGGRIARLSRLPARYFAFQSGNGTYKGAGVLSPDGHELAFLTNNCFTLMTRAGSTCQVGIRVVSLANGASKAWTQTLAPLKDSFFSLQPSWVDNGREIAFGRVAVGSRTPFRYWLLNVAGPGGSLLADSRLIFSTVWALPYSNGEALPTPDGRAFVMQSYGYPQPTENGGHGDAYIRVVERSVSTGRVLRVLYVLKVPERGIFGSTYCHLLSMGPTGVHVLMQCNNFGRLDGNHFTPLPGLPPSSADNYSATAAW